jgi:5-methylcytosine-specific restriction protein A
VVTACGFNFAARYGERGSGFIECHHTKPVSALRPGEKTRLEDLALLCANCHRMIHIRRPWMTVGQLKQALQALSGLVG